MSIPIVNNEDISVNLQSIKPSGFNHSFDVGIAKECGIEAACIFNHLCHWILHNRIKGSNYHEGRTWTYDNQEKMAQYLPYLNVRQIKYALQKLYDAKLIIKGNFNKDRFDKTNWYALNDESILGNSKKVYDSTKLSYRQKKDEFCLSKVQNCTIGSTKLSDVYNTDTIHTDTIPNTSLMVSNSEQNATESHATDVANEENFSSSKKDKKKKSLSSFSPKVKEVVDKMLAILHEHNPMYRPPKDMANFFEAVRKMLEEDNQDETLLLKTFTWAVKDNEKKEGFDGWQSIICSNSRKGKTSNPAEIFRYHASKLYGKMNAKKDRKFAPCSNDEESLAKMEEWSKTAL